MTDTLAVLAPATSPVKKSELAALGCAASIAASTGGNWDLLALGPAAVSVASELADRGARRVLHANHEDLESWTAEAYAAALAQLLEARDDRVVVTSTSSATREIFPRLAGRLERPLASDVLALESIDAECCAFTRAVFAGNVLVRVELDGPSVLATCRSSEFEAPSAGAAASDIEALELAGPLAHPRKRFVRLESTASERPDLGEAEIIVSVGRGTRGPDQGLPLCEELADLLGAAIGATRAAVDAGWIANEYQIGQTGKIVAPKFYFAIGMSGSIQHLAGMRNSKCIVTINKDPEAPIFEVTDIGLVADLFEAVPRLTELLRKARGH